MTPSELPSFTLAEMKDKYIGQIGTNERDEYEQELKMEVISRVIKTARQDLNMTQEELGQLVGVQKSQISKLENGISGTTLNTILKVLKVLKADIQINFKLDNQNLQLI